MVDLNSLCDELTTRLADLIAETKRLREENNYLLEENRRLREDLTVHQLRTDIASFNEIEEENLAEFHPAIPRDAVEFYRRLPDRLTFADFFQIAEEMDLPDERARSFLMLFLRESLLTQDGRRMQKRQRVRQSVET